MILGLLLASGLAFQVMQPAATETPEVCTVDVAAQMTRPWTDYEFATDSPGGPMWLAQRGCYRAAAAISRDYLARGPLLSVREQAITQLHMARNLAYAGDEAAAASARRSDQRLDIENPLDWNAYVQGLYGFLAKDRALLEDNLARLKASGAEGDAYNGRNLQALSTCFEASYTDAMTTASCWPDLRGGH